MAGPLLRLDEAVAVVEDQKGAVSHLKRLLGTLPIADVNKVRIMEYKNRRLSERLLRHKNAVEGTKVMGSTVNREVSCPVHALYLASDEGLCEGAPRVKKEREAPRDRVLNDAERKALLDVSPHWLQRVLIGAEEAPLDRTKLLQMTWDWIDDDLISAKEGRGKTGGRQRVGISPLLREVLDELRAEYRRTPNTERRVFTKDGKPIPAAKLRHAFDKAVGEAKIENFVFKDFRHCARNHWAAAGLPFEVAEIGLGHKLRGMAGIYTNLTDDHIRQAFQKMFTSCLHEERDAVSAG